MIRTPEEQYLHELIESYVAPLRSEIKALRKELAEQQVKNLNMPDVSGSALADLNHIIVNAAMNISTTAVEDTKIQTECRKIIDTVRGFTKHYR